MKSESNYLARAIESLCPDSVFSVADTYKSLTWGEANKDPKPLEADVLAEVEKLKQLDICYQNRKLNYPPIEDYLDAVVKGDLEQQQAYIDACLAVKAKYPKPE